MKYLININKLRKHCSYNTVKKRNTLGSDMRVMRKVSFERIYDILEVLEVGNLSVMLENKHFYSL